MLKPMAPSVQTDQQGRMEFPPTTPTALAPVFWGFIIAASIVLATTGSLSRALLVVSGPFAGAVARDGQSCCLANSWSIAPYALAGVVVGLTARLGIQANGRFWATVRSVLWWAGMFGWFCAALLSYMHSLE